MKRYIRSSVNGHSRGKGHPSTPEKFALRAIVNDIYDEVEDRNLIDYFANIKSAGKGYMIDYFRFKSGWMSRETAESLASSIEDVIDNLGYEDNASVSLKKEGSTYLKAEYGYDCYHVIVRVNPQ